MSAIHGKNTFVEIDDAAGTPVAVSPWFKSAGADKSFDTAESSTFMQPQGAKTFVLGMNDETISLEGNFDVAFHNHINAVVEAMNNGTIESITVTIGPAGNGTGKPRTTRECIITSYNWSAAIGDVVTASIEFQRTGPNDDGIFA